MTSVRYFWAKTPVRVHVIVCAYMCARVGREDSAKCSQLVNLSKMLLYYFEFFAVGLKIFK